MKMKLFRHVMRREGLEKARPTGKDERRQKVGRTATSLWEKHHKMDRNMTQFSQP